MDKVSQLLPLCVPAEITCTMANEMLISLCTTVDTPASGPGDCTDHEGVCKKAGTPARPRAEGGGLHRFARVLHRFARSARGRRGTARPRTIPCREVSKGGQKKIQIKINKIPQMLGKPAAGPLLSSPSPSRWKSQVSQEMMAITRGRKGIQMSPSPSPPPRLF